MPVRNTKAIPRADLERAMRKAHRAYGNRANFRGIDIGYRWTNGAQSDEICLRIHVEQKLGPERILDSQILPSEIDGVTLDVISGPYGPTLGKRPGASQNDNSSARPPYAMAGLACGRSGESIGSVGLMVIDETTGKPGLLSNWHVLAGPRAHCNDPVMLPCEQDEGHDPRDHVARLKRWVLGRSGDAAFAELLPDQPWLPLQFGSFKSIDRARPVQLGEILTKTSQTAGTSRARVDGEGLYRLRYEIRPGVFEFRDIEGFKLVALDADTVDTPTVSLAGESGAAWISEITGEAIGLHFGGDIGPDAASDRAIACNVTSVLDRLQLRLATFEDLLAQNSQGAVLTQQQKISANLSAGQPPESTLKDWPHPVHWAQDWSGEPSVTELRAAPQPEAAPVFRRHRPDHRQDRAGHQQYPADVLPLIRIQPRGLFHSPPQDFRQSPSARHQIILQEIWPLHLYPALLDCNPNFQGVLLEERLTHRIQAISPAGIAAFLAQLINGSLHFDGIGLQRLRSEDFIGVATYRQACERILAALQHQ